LRSPDSVARDVGATAIEYALIASLIAVAIIGAVTTVGTNINNVMGEAANALK
jgi:pilus assembly protein Flp/PilA